MTLASIENPSRTAHSAKTDFSETQNASSARTENRDFGQAMTQAMQPVQETLGHAAGQGMAANPAVLPGLPGAVGTAGALGGDFLKAVHLGPYMNVITSEAAVPDEQSLEAFARSQGLDETAVQWLMGTSPAVAATPPTGVPEMTTSGGSAALLGVAGAVGAEGATTPGTEVSTLDVSSDSVAANPAAPSPGDASAKGTANKSDMPTLPNALNAAALWAMTQATEQARVSTPAQQDPTDAAKVQINLMASPAPAAFWMLRNPLVAAAPSKEPVTTPSGIALSEIDLTQAATPELLESLGQSLAEGGTSGMAGEQPTPLSGHSGQRLDMAAAARQDAQNPDASASAPDSGNAQRSENVQNLAEKMGQAVGQRILSEIEKGQWHLKLSLRPATLGHIEVEMRMRSGELDAVFTAPQAVTRELLQEGMSKLKDTLNQMGMDVASMQVGDGQTQKNGGESTPGQMSKSANSDSDDSKSALSAAQAPVTRMKMGKDGWDVLV